MINANPIKVLMILIHLLERIKSEFSFNHIRCEQIRYAVESKGISLINTIHSIPELEVLLKS